jgi:adenylate cyclase
VTAADPDQPVAEPNVTALFEQVEQSVLGGPRRYARAEVSQLAGVSPEQARRLWRELGFAAVGDDDVVFTDSDVRALRQVRFLAENGLDDDELRHAISRLLGQTFARLACSQGELLVDLVAGQPELAGSPQAIGDLVDAVLPVMEQIQSYVWRRQLVAYFARVAAHAPAEAIASGAAPTAVGFADMSGFTSLTRRASEAELRNLLEAFESTTTEIVGAHGGRIVKTIGDEILFVADSVVDGAEIALELLAAAGRDDRLPLLRVGLAAGPVVTRLGDVYGSTVNIASRLTALCRPGWVLVDRVMADQLRGQERFSLTARRPESVRGYRHLRQWRLRHAGELRPHGRSERVGSGRGARGALVERAAGRP